MSLTVRPAQAADAPILAQFNCALAFESEHRKLNPLTVEAGVRALLAEPTRGFYWVAERDAQVVGGLLVTFEWSDWRNGNFWWIQSVYVIPSARRQGVFRALFHTIQDQARSARNVCGLRLYVEQNNGQALSTYQQLGMGPTPYRVLEMELPIQAE